ncbi:MAG: hypothetical protein C5B50_06265 [Verrucomicrobia bacterium]|nr:MAG: hypothetical protein C5B50_06265 [Verrucomicrobiota bacterium]
MIDNLKDTASYTLNLKSRDNPMRALPCFSPMIIFFLVGCASAPHARLEGDYPTEKAQITERLSQICDACAKKDFVRLDSYHLFGPKFTKFTTQAPDRLDADAARNGEHDSLGAAPDLAMQTEDLKVDIFGDVGIATFILKYSFSGPSGRVEKQARSTLVFVKDHGDWKIAHEHLSGIATAP